MLEKTESPIKNVQCSDAGNTRHIRHRTETKKNNQKITHTHTHTNTHRRLKIWATRSTPKTLGWTHVIGKSKQLWRLRTDDVCSDYNLYIHTMSNTDGHFSFWVWFPEYIMSTNYIYHRILHSKFDI